MNDKTTNTPQPELGQICLQLHPHLATGLDLDQLAKAFEAIARATEGVRGFGVTQGDDDGPYLNIVFAADEPVAAGRGCSRSCSRSPPSGAALRAACMVMCTGANGWDDYLLLAPLRPSRCRWTIWMLTPNKA
jgi:hypothetical protein